MEGPYLALSRIHAQVGVLNRLVLNRLGGSTARSWCYSAQNPFKTSAKPKRDRGRDSQPRPRPRLNSQPQGATKEEILQMFLAIQRLPSGRFVALCSHALKRRGALRLPQPVCVSPLSLWLAALRGRRHGFSFHVLQTLAATIRMIEVNL